jgi:phage head maturation protease
MVDRIDFDARAHERNERFLARNGRPGYRNTVFSDVTDRALDGEVLRFNTVFEYKGDKVAFVPGAFGDTSKQDVKWCIDHIDATASASTGDGSLELMIDDEAVRFRVHLEKSTQGPVLARMAEIGARDATSISCDILDETKMEIAGERVRVVRRARMKELTQCSTGAVASAFCQLVDTTVTPKPTSGTESATFTAGRALHKINRQIKAMRQGRAAIHTEPALAPKFAMTVSQSNRLHTDETEALQRNVRGTHSLYI